MSGARVYNYNRNYDPTLGRYVQSDPKGIHGGIATYGYANAEPLLTVDPFGLAPKGPGNKWVNCTAADNLFCNDLCGPRGVESCKHQVYWGTSVIDGKIVQGWVPSREPSCNCNEYADPPKACPAVQPPPPWLIFMLGAAAAAAAGVLGSP